VLVYYIYPHRNVTRSRHDMTKMLLTWWSASTTHYDDTWNNQSIIQNLPNFL